MKFLKSKFFDQNNALETFLDSGNCLKRLEKSDQISESVKRQFAETFVKNLIDSNVISTESINSVDDQNAWSIDFPGWHGEFDETQGKKIFVIGAEPHIYNKYLQTVYGLNNEKSINELIENGHPIFRYLSEILADRFQISNQEVISETYLTDLFPLSPFRGSGLKVGSADKIQNVIGSSDNWSNIRHKYAKSNLASEIKFVKPQIILTQGKDVFYEVVEILGSSEQRTKIAIVPESGKKQYVRTTKWENIPVVSVPHIGSQRMRTFWNQNLNTVKQVISEL
ncbi:MAG: hypothetical protein ABJN36_09930 [Cyclobacteriaceae bacterium]